jgi:hypothetical protein
MARIYLDWDLTATCFSFKANEDATPEAVVNVLKSTYDSHCDCDKQDRDVEDVTAYMQNRLKPLLVEYKDRITILTANSASNVEKICTQFDIPTPDIYSVHDAKDTKYAYILDQDKWFMFLDDSQKEIASVAPLASHMGGVVVPIVRPPLNAPVADCGMFGRLSTEAYAQKYPEFVQEGRWDWHAYIEACLKQLDAWNVPTFASAESAQYRTFV